MGSVCIDVGVDVSTSSGVIERNNSNLSDKVAIAFDVFLLLHL